jgi:hypothetical protein
MVRDKRFHAEYGSRFNEERPLTVAEVEAPEGSQILALGKTPTQWVEVMAGMGH